MMARALSSTAASSSATASTSTPPRVAVIGAGAAGLAAARIISRDASNNNPSVETVVLEKETQGGGVWRYYRDDKGKTKKDRPMYAGLRTNLPKELMAFRDYPIFAPEITASFITHKQVQDYLMDYQRHFDLSQYVHYQCQVDQLRVLPDTRSKLSPPHEQWPQIQLEWTDQCQNITCSETFDSVLVCNGHYAAPSAPRIPGLNDNDGGDTTSATYFKGQVMHSIEYDTPQPFQGQVVLCIGGRASGADLAREISQYATHVYLSDTTCSETSQDGKVTLVPKTIAIEPDGSVRFDGNCPIRPNDIDTIILCSGYDYQFPFVNEHSKLPDFSATPGERRVQPLVHQLWHARYPSLAFLGLPHSVVPFPLFELQSEAIVAQWTIQNDNHDSRLPALSERLQMAQLDAESGGPKNTPRMQDTHFLGDFQWDYCRQMAKLAGLLDKDMEAYIETNRALYDHAGAARKSESPGGPDHYRSIRYARPSAGEWHVLENVLK